MCFEKRKRGIVAKTEIKILRKRNKKEIHKEKGEKERRKYNKEE
jgi:hypothetical protein